MMLCSALQALMVPKVAGVFIRTRVHSCKWRINIKRLCQRFSLECQDNLKKHGRQTMTLVLRYLLIMNLPYFLRIVFFFFSSFLSL